MKHITKGNDFLMRIPVVRIYNGERIPMPLPACTDIIVNICSPYRRISLAYTIDVTEDNVILAKVEGDQLYVGKYALEVKGKIGGVDWRSNEYEQIAIVDNNASADTSFDVTEEGEDSLLMDTAIAILAPDTGLYDKVLTAEEAREAAESARQAAESERIAKEEERIDNEEKRKASEASRIENESVRLANEQSRTKAETERVEAENTRKANESERVRNETSRSEAEIVRERDETKRKSAETTRGENETERKANENERKAAETARAKAETLRQQAETARGNAETLRQQNESERQKAEQERIANNEKCVTATNSALSAAEKATTAANNAMQVASTAEATIAKSEKAASDAAAAVETANSALSAAEDATNAANNAIQEAAAAEAERANAESERKQAETARANAEAARQQAESARQQNEAARQQNETSRTEAETHRAAAETKRTEAENIRKQKETERQEAEQERIANNEKCVTATNSALSAATDATTAANNAMQVASTAEATIAKSEKAASDAAAAVETANSALSAATDATTAANNATTDATNAAGEANAAAERANKAADLVYNGPDENVSVACYTDVEGISTAGLVLNVYINENTVPQQYTTDSNGLAAFKVTKGLRYDIVFPDIEGCAPIGRLSYTAALQTRGIEVTYHEAIVAAQEKVTISFMKFPENTTWNGGEAYPDGVARVTIDGIETVYNADSNGQAQFFVPIGKEYRVSIDKPADLHLITGAYSATYTADRAARVIPVSFHPYLSDILIVDKDGGEWTYDGFIASGKDVSEGVLLHIATEELLAVGCDFFMSVDVMAYRKFDTDKTEIRTMSWAAQGVQFTSIPLNGNDASQEYYYDGFTATNLIVQEGLSRGINTDCHTRTLRETYALGVTTLQGFTPSTGQYAPLIANYTYINDIITFLRPDGDVVNKFWNFDKGTSTQQSAADAFYVSSYVQSISKNRGHGNFAPVCAYAKPTL